MGKSCREPSAIAATRAGLHLPSLRSCRGALAAGVTRASIVLLFALAAFVLVLLGAKDFAGDGIDTYIQHL